jgi:hypothetical protein
MDGNHQSISIGIFIYPGDPIRRMHMGLLTVTYRPCFDHGTYDLTCGEGIASSTLGFIRWEVSLGFICWNMYRKL